jgi:hypothetical protein
MTAEGIRTTVAATRTPLICPLPRLDGVEPQICMRDTTTIELGYPGRTKVPPFVPVFAMAPGRVRREEGAPPGYVVQLTHAGDRATHYCGLGLVLALHRARRKPVGVRTGDVLGYMDRERPYIRVELLRRSPEGWRTMDPLDEVIGWSFLPWFTDPRPEDTAPPQRDLRAPRPLDRTIHAHAGRGRRSHA